MKSSFPLVSTPANPLLKNGRAHLKSVSGCAPDDPFVHKNRYLEKGLIPVWIFDSLLNTKMEARDGSLSQNRRMCLRGYKGFSEELQPIMKKR